MKGEKSTTRRSKLCQLTEFVKKRGRTSTVQTRRRCGIFPTHYSIIALLWGWPRGERGAFVHFWVKLYIDRV